MEEKKAKRTQERGITLIALVVTIVVLLILAGVSIVVLFGDNGMIKTAGDSSLQTKFAEIEERANIAYADLNAKKYADGNPNRKITMLDVKAELEKIDKEKYQIRTENLEGSTIKGIKLDKDSIKIGKGATKTLTVTYEIEENSNTHYYVKVEEKYYEISITNNHIHLDKTNGKTEDQIQDAWAGQTKIITATSSNSNVVNITEEQITQTETGASIEITAGEELGNATITVSCEGLESKECTVTVAIQPTAGATPNASTSITTGFGKIDILWLDENNNIILEPKAPILQSKANPTAEEKVKMTPVKWNGTGATVALVDSEIDETNAEITKDDGTKEKAWYDYEKQYWANAITENGSYFVWIPRYAYRITYYKSETDHTITGYYDGYGMWSAKTGAVKYALEEGIETVEATDGNNYIVHPAFGSSKQQTGETNEQYVARKTKNINNGGWGETLTGFWFAKFEMSGTDDSSLKSSPEGKSVRSKSIGEFYTMGRTATYGQTGVVVDKAIDEITLASYMNSHMVKNSEWGAVAYLSHSKYGRNGKEITINGPSDSGTGGGSSATSYLSNQNQSTTGNPYGVYDMNGGAYEFTAVFNSIFGNSSKWTANTGLTTASNSTKYATKYVNDSNATSGDAIYIVCKTGDAIKEVSINGVSAWFGDYNYILYEGLPFQLRGGHWSRGTNAGIFAADRQYGSADSSYSFRTALCPFII